MNRVRTWLFWSPFERGTWQEFVVTTVVLVGIMTVVQALFGQLDTSSWLGGLTATTLVGAVRGLVLRRRHRQSDVG